ncbi:protoglobin domain-containing protein [Oceanicaulis sp. LC35]|uniref:protoglobin domain-containing protein n=1 Tax=Oceanicaulis sp. LC35 TaxID=3349635 RepID=UPI003F85BE5C
MNTQDRTDRLDFLGFDPELRKALTLCGPTVEEALPRALDAFYAVVRANPATQRFFSDDAHIQSARQRQHAHWMSILSGQYDSVYFDGVRKIGLAHSRLGLEPRFYIGGYAHLASALIRAVAAPVGAWPRFAAKDAAQRAQQLDALVKAIFLDMELVVSLYLEETELSAAHERDGIASTFEQGVGHVIQTLQTVSETTGAASEEVSRTIGTTLERAIKAAAGAESSADSVRAVAAASEQMQAATGEIAQRAQAQADIARNAEGLASMATTDIERLNQAATQIGGVVTLIQQIAEQTNLLALNATIESARAGEAGKGFAVVASEVKLLASQTARATQDIGGEIAAIQAATHAVVEAMAQIRDTISQIAETSTSISAAVEEQASATAEITRSSTTAAQGNEAVAVAASEMEQSTREVSGSVATMTTASARMQSCSAELSASVDQFLTSLRRAL